LKNYNSQVITVTDIPIPLIQTVTPSGNQKKYPQQIVGIFAGQLKYSQQTIGTFGAHPKRPRQTAGTSASQPKQS
jgi:hypothetical protein